MNQEVKWFKNQLKQISLEKELLSMNTETLRIGHFFSEFYPDFPF